MPKRNYAEAYARRIARGLAKGWTRSQSRGHPGPTESLVSGRTSRAKTNDQLEAAVKQMRSGKSLRAAAKAIGVAPERLQRYLTNQGVGVKVSGRWKVGPDFRTRDVLIYSDGHAVVIEVPDYETARLAGEYMVAVEEFLATHDETLLVPYDGRSVQDIDGHSYSLEVDPNTLYSLKYSGNGDFSRIYSINPGVI